MDMRSPRESEQSEKKQVECSDMKGQVRERDTDTQARAVGRNSMMNSAADSRDGKAFRGRTLSSATERPSKDGTTHRGAKPKPRGTLAASACPTASPSVLGPTPRKQTPRWVCVEVIHGGSIPGEGA